MDIKHHIADTKAAFTQRLAGHGLRSQEHTPSKDQIVYAKLFMPFGSGTWYITEYDPQCDIAFGYVMGLGGDEWGSIDIQELLEVTHHLKFFDADVAAVELDVNFTPKAFAEVKAAHVEREPKTVVVYVDSGTADEPLDEPLVESAVLVPKD